MHVHECVLRPAVALDGVLDLGAERGLEARVGGEVVQNVYEALWAKVIRRRFLELEDTERRTAALVLTPTKIDTIVRMIISSSDRPWARAASMLICSRSFYMMRLLVSRA